MLKSAVSVRRAQRKHVRRDQAAEHAWKEGIAIVQADFGARLIDQVKRDLQVRGRRARGLRGALCLLRVLSGRYDEDHERRCQSARLAARL